jgi:hypothetical protein
MENTKILKELQDINKTIKEMFIFLLCREGYSQAQIRNIFGKIDNTKITKVGAGVKKSK